MLLFSILFISANYEDILQHTCDHTLIFMTLNSVQGHTKIHWFSSLIIFGFF